MSRARQGGLRPNRRHVQRGSDMISFVLDVGGKIQSAFPRFFHQPPIPGRWQPCRTVGRNPAVALVAQSDSERLTTDQEVAGSNPVRGTWGGKPFRCLSSASCSTCVGSLTAEYRSPKPVGVRSRLTRRARTVLFGSLVTHGFVKPNDTVPPGSDRRLKDFLFSSAVRPEPSPRWRNRQTHPAQTRIPDGVGVRIPHGALSVGTFSHSL